ncbi:hypothetical protein CSUB01_02427 [Colletotrichum sublineola]|uniref:Uncharacterized protein n=1 Tax=Colletotrichum sublineola TaxID=1173701 RepID=A0A066X0B3_COLSU|nr:hypothetical protein CSUB01_02427 [Colletotrichum sublineola]
MVAVHPAHAAAARLGGVMGAQPWGPSPWSPSSRRRGPGEEDMGMGSMGRHKLISFLDDVDPDADESEYVLPCCPSSLTFSPSLTLSTSVPVTYYSLIDSCDENDDDAIGSDLSTEADFSNSHIYPRPASSSSSTGPTATAIVTAATTQATTQAQAETQAQAQATVTTSTMAPMTNADSFLSLGGGGGDARSHGQTTTVAGTAVYRRTSEDSVDGSHGLWDYFHHGLDGNSTPDLHQFQQQRRQPTQQSKQQQQRHNLQQQHHQHHHHHHRHCHQQQHQSSSPTSYLSLYLRPKEPDCGPDSEPVHLAIEHHQEPREERQQRQQQDDSVNGDGGDDDDDDHNDTKHAGDAVLGRVSDDRGPAAGITVDGVLWRRDDEAGIRGSTRGHSAKDLCVCGVKDTLMQMETSRPVTGERRSGLWPVLDEAQVVMTWVVWPIDQARRDSPELRRLAPLALHYQRLGAAVMLCPVPPTPPTRISYPPHLSSPQTQTVITSLPVQPTTGNLLQSLSLSLCLASPHSMHLVPNIALVPSGPVSIDRSGSR